MKIEFGEKITSFIYFDFRTAFNDEQKHRFEELVKYFKENVDPLSKDLAFLLGTLQIHIKKIHGYLYNLFTGFFVKSVVSRWWSQYTKLPNPGYFTTETKEQYMIYFCNNRWSCYATTWPGAF